jgi:hypothetical protein
MSGSPKYTSAQLSAAREREVEARRLERERQRAEQELQARARREAALRAAFQSRIDALAVRTAGLRTDAGSTGFGTQHDTVTAELARARTALGNAAHEAQLHGAGSLVTTVEESLQRLGMQINDVLARQRRAEALAAIRSSLVAEPDRHELDPADRGRVDALVERAAAVLTDAAAFQRLHQDLSQAVDEHLTRARTWRLELARMREHAGVAIETLTGILDELDAAEATLEGAGSAAETLRLLHDASDAGDVHKAHRLTADAEAAGTSLNAAFEQWLVEQDRTALIIEAMREALPAAGLKVDDGSFQFVGSGGRFVARDAGQRTVEIAVLHDKEGSQIVYHADGRDFTVEHTAQGEVSRCDLTEELLGRFHGELAKQEVETGELFWQGKPGAPRPDDRAYAQRPRSGTTGAGK